LRVRCRSILKSWRTSSDRPHAAIRGDSPDTLRRSCVGNEYSAVAGHRNSKRIRKPRFTGLPIAEIRDTVTREHVHERSPSWLEQ
jgi:hypothetical protein